MTAGYKDYGFKSTAESHMHRHFMPQILGLAGELKPGTRVLDGGHIKLWSKRTLTELLQEVGFRDVTFRAAGRVPGLWMTMIAKAQRPA